MLLYVHFNFNFFISIIGILKFHVKKLLYFRELQL